MSTPLTLEAPDVNGNNLNETTQLANTGATHTSDFSVEVGATRGKYGINRRMEEILRSGKDW